MVSQEQRNFEQLVYLTSNTIATQTGRLICVYKNNLLVANSHLEMHQLLDCIWK